MCAARLAGVRKAAALEAWDLTAWHAYPLPPSLPAASGRAGQSAGTGTRTSGTNAHESPVQSRQPVGPAPSGTLRHLGSAALQAEDEPPPAIGQRRSGHGPPPPGRFVGMPLTGRMYWRGVSVGGALGILAVLVHPSRRCTARISLAKPRAAGACMYQCGASIASRPAMNGPRRQAHVCLPQRMPIGPLGISR